MAMAQTFCSSLPSAGPGDSHDHVRPRNHLAAFNCRLPAVWPCPMQGLEIPKATRAPEITGLLEVLMGKLEKDRAAVTVRGCAVVCVVVWLVRSADRQDGEGQGG